jgi:hypothetical protein
MAEPENLVLVLLRHIRTDIVDMREKMATKDGIADVRSEVRSLRADVASDLASLDERLSGQIAGLDKRLSEQIAGLRRAVMEYHSSAIGHGVLMSEFEERLRRVEQHLKLPPVDAH